MATLTELLGLKKSPLEQKRIQKKLSDLKGLNIVGQTDPRFITVDPSIKIADDKSQKSLMPDISTLQIPDANVPTLDKIIGEIGGSPAFIEAIRSHYDQHGLPLDHMMKKALFAVDELCGFIVAVTLVRPSKQMADVKVKSVMKKLKDKSFAAAVDRKLIYTCEENLGVTIEEFVEMTLGYLKPIAADFGM